MIGSLITMFIIGAAFMFCVLAILFLRYVEPMINCEEDDSDFYPYDDADMEQMSLWYEEEYHGKHE